MSAAPLALLFVEDLPEDVELVESLLLREGLRFEAVRVETGPDFRAALASRTWDLIFADYLLPAFHGMEALVLRQELQPDTPFVVISGTIGEEVAVECLKEGATDYVLKSRMGRLAHVVRRALRESEEIRRRKSADEALRRTAQERLELLEAVSVARVVPWSQDPATGLVRVGHSAEPVLGWPSAHLSGEPEQLWSLVPPADQERFREALRRVQDEAVVSFEGPVRSPEGHTLWTRWTLSQEGGALRGVLQDLTEQHALLEQLLHSQKMETLGSLAGAVAHDFSNLAQAILSQSELLEMNEQLPAEDRRSVDLIRQAADKAKGLVGRLLAFSRKREPEKRLGDLNALAVEVTRLVGTMLGRNIRLDLDLRPELPELRMDPDQLHQVLMNLLVNARDAIGEVPGTVTVRTGTARMEAPGGPPFQTAPGDYAFVEVEDTGGGIPAGHLQRIFEPFFTTKEAGKGTGLGLSVVHTIVKDHAGGLEVHSEPGKGTRFRVLLPLASSALAEMLEGQP